MLLEATLFGGKIKMRDATKSDLLESAAKYDAQSTDMRIKALHQRLVASALEDGKVVADAMTNEQLSELWDRARAQVQIPA